MSVNYISKPSSEGVPGIVDSISIICLHWFSSRFHYSDCSSKGQIRRQLRISENQALQNRLVLCWNISRKFATRINLTRQRPLGKLNFGFSLWKLIFSFLTWNINEFNDDNRDDSTGEITYPPNPMIIPFFCKQGYLEILAAYIKNASSRWPRIPDWSKNSNRVHKTAFWIESSFRLVNSKSNKKWTVLKLRKLTAYFQISQKEGKNVS